MHNFGKRVKHIYEYGTDTEKEYTTDILNKVVCIAKTTDYDSMVYYNLEIRSMVDKELTVDMIDEVLSNKYWSMDDVKSVMTSKGLTCKLEDLYFMANLYHHKYSDIIEDDKILAMAVKDVEHAMHYWKIKKMK